MNMMQKQAEKTLYTRYKITLVSFNGIKYGIKKSENIENSCFNIKKSLYLSYIEIKNKISSSAPMETKNAQIGRFLLYIHTLCKHIKQAATIGKAFI